MPKYGWFKAATKYPTVVYEGDYMEMDKEYVKIFKYPPETPAFTGRLIAAIRLDKGQDVREIDETTLTPSTGD